MTSASTYEYRPVEAPNANIVSTIQYLDYQTQTAISEVFSKNIVDGPTQRYAITANKQSGYTSPIANTTKPTYHPNPHHKGKIQAGHNKAHMHRRLVKENTIRD